MPAPDERPDAINDARIIADSRGNPSVFALIFDRHYDAISSYLGRRVDRGLANELASETFVRAFAYRDAYDAAHVDARPWLYGIATNLLHKHQRTEERRRRAYSRAVEPQETGGGIDCVVARVDAVARGPAVAVALARLQSADRDTLLLLALTDLDYEGIAIATDVPVGTVRSRLHRARRHMKNDLALNELGPTPENAKTERSRT
jgi:RNA polymerase sigma factor (sigma-70 family)